jgi:ATP-dependent helicase/nuclease subunit B
MGSRSAAEIDAWLRGGGLVVTASERAARALESAFNRARRTEGLAAWPAPNIEDWKSFVRNAWEERTQDGRLLLNSAQEQSLWTTIAGKGEHLATLLEGPRYRLASLAMDAYELLCSYAPHYLRPSARAAWQQDAAAFSDWLAAFDEACRTGNLLSPARLPLELISLLDASSPASAQVERPPLLLAGFDRILPVQRNLFDAWGAWKQPVLDDPAKQIGFYEAPDTKAELAACALWCSGQLAANPQARLLVVTQDASSHRGEIERAFLKHTASASAPRFEFSLGIPLGQVALARGAYLLLRWLSAPLAEHEVDWLLSTGQAAASLSESSALQAAMRTLRRRGLEQTHWTIDALIGQSLNDPLPAAWINRITEAQRRLAEFARLPQTPLGWAELVPQVLQAAGWPGARPLSSAEFQAAHRFQQTVETCGSLGFDGRRIQRQEFLSVLSRTLDETLFAPESRDAPILIAGPTESAGLTADAVWFLGSNEDAWPAGGATHPLLPHEVQREAAMPHATAQLDWDLSQAISTRLLASAPEINFSYSKQIEGTEARPSRLILQLAGAPEKLPKTALAEDPITVCFEDYSRIPFPSGNAEGGSSLLTNQSQCPFKAFATARLAAQSWEPAHAGLTPSQRGKLLHAVLHSIWAGPPTGIRTLDELKALQDRGSFVSAHIHRVMRDELRPGLRQRLPHRYLELEEQRLTELVGKWLDYETARIDFQVADTEVDSVVNIAGLTLNLRLDRVDRLNDNSLLVIDYKTGNVFPKSWDLPRPDDIQLPLYAGFALDLDEELGGLVFAKVRAGDQAFTGRVGNAKTTLLANLHSNSSLIKESLTAELLIDWREHIEQLAKDFLAGRAEVDPREYPKTCERCGLQTLCRVQENQALLEAEDGSEDEDRADE